VIQRCKKNYNQKQKISSFQILHKLSKKTINLGKYDVLTITKKFSMLFCFFVRGRINVEENLKIMEFQEVMN